MSRPCGACGAPAPPPFRAPPPELAPDLDLRPGEPTRSTLPRWVATCRACGACAPDLAALPPAARAVVQSPEYRAEPDRFRRWFMLAADGEERASALLQSAWTSDDAGEDAAATRREAAALLAQGGSIQDGLQALDAWRRAGAAAEATAQAERLLARPELTETDRAVVAFQQRLLTDGDTGRHLISSALRPPARTPHASHAAARSRGFWGRVLGR